MREGLLDHGVEGEVVTTLREAIGRLAASAYDLVVCDLVLCDPPDAANPALRGYLAVCFALARCEALVVQASALRRYVHPGAVLTNFQVNEVANLLYSEAASGIPAWQSADAGCPWETLERADRVRPELRPAIAHELAGLPIVRSLEGSLPLLPRLEALEDAAHGAGDWGAAVAAVRDVLFPGAGDAS